MWRPTNGVSPAYCAFGNLAAGRSLKRLQRRDQAPVATNANCKAKYFVGKVTVARRTSRICRALSYGIRMWLTLHVIRDVMRFGGIPALQRSRTATVRWSISKKQLGCCIHQHPTIALRFSRPFSRTAPTMVKDNETVIKYAPKLTLHSYCAIDNVQGSGTSLST